MSIDIARLTKKVDVDDRIDLRYYYRIADNLIRKADMYRAKRKLIDLYVTLVRFVSLITETIPYHKDYRLSPQSERKDFKRILLSVRSELVALKPDVERRLAAIHRNTSVPADRQAQPQQNGSSDPYVLPPVRQTAPLVEQHLQENDLSATPLPYRVSISPSLMQNGTVSRSSHVANSAPEQPPVSRAMPVPIFLNNSAPEQPLVNKTMPVPTSSTNSAPEQPLVNRIMPVPNFLTDSDLEQPLINRIMKVPTSATNFAPEQPLINRTMPAPTSSTNSAPEQPLVNKIMRVPTFLTDSAPEQPLVNITMPIPTSSTDSAPEQPLVNRIMPVPTSSINSAPEQPLVNRTMLVPTSSTNSAPEQPLVNRTMPVPTFLTDSAPELPWVHRTMPEPTFLRHLVSSSAVHIVAPRSTGINSLRTRTTEPDMTDLEHDELARAIKASIETAIAEGVQIEPSLVQETSRIGTTVSLNDPWAFDTTLDQETYDNAYFNYPSDASPNTATEANRSAFEGGEEGRNGLCIVCLDSQVEAACIPCGHMAGCLACFKKIEAKSKKCPVCRATVDQVVKIYTA